MTLVLEGGEEGDRYLVRRLIINQKPKHQNLTHKQRSLPLFLPLFPSDGEVGPDLLLFPSEGDVGPDLPDFPVQISSRFVTQLAFPALPSDGDVGPDFPLFPSEGEVGPDFPLLLAS